LPVVFFTTLAGLLWADEVPDDEVAVVMGPPPAPVAAPVVPDEDDEEPALIRARGQALRDRLRINMPR
jgi:hypothetical protein